jgi:hypothetical protein
MKNKIQIIDFKPINTVIDCYTKSPVSKFGLKYEIDENIINATGVKMNFYSVNKIADGIGCFSQNTSITGIVKEFELEHL